MIKNKIVRRVGQAVLFVFLFMNIIALFQAYRFTHFSDANTVKTDPKKMTVTGKMKALFLGVNNPRPLNNRTPAQKFTSVVLTSNKKIACWQIHADKSKGTVILFHGYGGQKSSLIRKSDEFLKLGYSTLLVDFMGSGESEGNQTTIGFKESEEVKTCYDYIKSLGEKDIFLSGNSMGAVAIMKAIKEYNLQPAGIIIECPFGSMYETTCARFRMVKIPVFPLAGLLVFWGGVENGFWAFGHNPTEYAKAIKCPTLLLYGAKDDRVSRQEIDEIYSNLSRKKSLVIFPMAGHEEYLREYKQEWFHHVGKFMQDVN